MKTRRGAVRRARGCRRDHGAGMLEYTGGTVAIAAVLTAVVVLIGGASFGGTVVANACRAYNAVFGGTLACAMPQGPAEPEDPYEQATSGDYVALGDSFSSGEGAGDYAPGTDFDDREDLWPFNYDQEKHNRCHRSANSYSAGVYAGNPFKGDYKFVACSGAVNSDFQNPNHSSTDEDPQENALSDKTSLVTLTIGGNDLGFVQVVEDCFWSGERGLPWRTTCQAKHDQRIQDYLDTLKTMLVKQYLNLKNRAPNARIIVVGYPPLFDESSGDSYRNLLFKEDMAWMNEKAGQLNATIAAAAREAGVEFVDPTAAFAGHGIGSKDPWVNDLYFGGAGWTPVNPGSFHPNAAGQAALAALVNEQLHHPR